MNSRPTTRKSTTKTHPTAARSGLSLLELALVMPLLFASCCVAMEFCRVAMIRHTVNNAVYEGCRAGVMPGATAQEIEREARKVLGSLALVKARIVVEPAVIEPDAERVRVRVEVPLDENSLVPHPFTGGREVASELSMRREQ